jgi:RecJ-like exonuclease
VADWIFTHSDGDGICAGALALAANPNAKIFFTHPHGLLEDLGNVNEGDIIIICDIAFPEDNLQRVLNRLSTINDLGGLTYIDHHPLPEGLSSKNIPGTVIHSLSASASELAYMFFQGEINPLLSRVAIYGAIADYLDDTPVICDLLRGWDKRTLYFETGILVQGIEGRKRDHDFKRSVVTHLAKNNPPDAHMKLLESAIENTRREEELIKTLREHIHVSGLVAYTLNVQFSLGKTSIYVRALTNAVVGVAGERRKQIIDMSLRTCDVNVDLNKILRCIAPKFGGSGGGHPSAAGARIPEEKFDEFIRELNRALAYNKN